MRDNVHNENHFKTFAAQLEGAIARYGDLSEEDLTERQRRQVEQLVAHETEFRKVLIKHPEGNNVYKAFVEYIAHEKGNILDARPFFRERQAVFTNEISVALKNSHEKGLYPYHFNYRFVCFVMKARKWGKTSRLHKLAREIEASRTELVEMNMPLAISRARIFWSRNQRNHLDYMDLIQIAAEGLMSAIDKFVLPYSPVFRAVAIGRMLGNFIEQTSETMVHFYPTDKRKIYRANKALGRLKDGFDYQKIANEVNKGIDENHHTTPEEIADLLSAVSCVSADAQPSTSEGETGEGLLDRFSVLPEQQPDNMVEASEAFGVMRSAMSGLSVFERKVLQLHGVDLL